MSKYPLPKSVATNLKDLEAKFDELVLRVDAIKTDPANPGYATLEERVKDIEDILWGEDKAE